MRYSKSFIPTQASEPCVWCFNEKTFNSINDYEKSSCSKCQNRSRFINFMWKKNRYYNYQKRIGKLSRQKFPCSLKRFKKQNMVSFSNLTKTCHILFG